MRFLVNPNTESLARARAPVRVFLGFCALLVLGAGLQRLLGGGLDPETLELLYRPDGPGRVALAAPALWEELHQAAFLHGFLILMLGSSLVVSPVAPRERNLLLWVTFAAVLADVLAPVGIALGLPGSLRLLTSLAAGLTLLGCVVTVAVRFGKDRR